MSRCAPGPALLLVAGCLPVLAGAQNVEDALRDCSQRREAEQRLACFDAVVNTLPQIKADRFGMTAAIEGRRDPGAMSHSRDETLRGKIASLRQGANGEWIFTLDNHQVWIETELRRNVDFSPDEEVRIEHGAMSSLWLVADKHRKVRVKRLQ